MGWLKTVGGLTVASILLILCFSLPKPGLLHCSMTIENSAWGVATNSAGVRQYKEPVGLNLVLCGQLVAYKLIPTKEYLLTWSPPNWSSLRTTYLSQLTCLFDIFPPSKLSYLVPAGLQAASGDVSWGTSTIHLFRRQYPIILGANPAGGNTLKCPVHLLLVLSGTTAHSLGTTAIQKWETKSTSGLPCELNS